MQRPPKRVVCDLLTPSLLPCTPQADALEEEQLRHTSESEDEALEEQEGQEGAEGAEGGMEGEAAGASDSSEASASTSACALPVRCLCAGREGTVRGRCAL